MKKSSAREKTESQFLLITGVLVALVGGPAFLTLIRQPVIETVKVTKQESRSPASLVQESAVVVPTYSQEKFHKNVIEKNSVVQIDCEKEVNLKLAEQEVQSPYLRFAGVGCKKENEIEIHNKTNGFTAEVIFTKDNQFTTDYIDLSVGQNDLEVVSTLKNGAKFSQKLKVSRRAPASTKE